MKLTEEQREILCFCVGCQAPLDPETAGEALESGRLKPSELACPSCHEDPEHAEQVTYWLAKVKAAELVTERIVEAGLGEEYAQEAYRQAMERDMRRRGENN